MLRAYVQLADSSDEEAPPPPPPPPEALLLAALQIADAAQVSSILQESWPRVLAATPFEDGSMPLDVAVGLLALLGTTLDSLGIIEVISLLLDADADPNCCKPPLNESPLQLAIRANMSCSTWMPYLQKWVCGRVVLLLIEANADADHADQLGEGPLSEAAVAGHFELCEVLLAHGASPHARNIDGQRALDIATHTMVKSVLLNAVSQATFARPQAMKVRCPIGHVLYRKHSSALFPWICDSCEMTSETSTRLKFSCVSCDFDLCEPCFKAEQYDVGKSMWLEYALPAVDRQCGDVVSSHTPKKGGEVAECLTGRSWMQRRRAAARLKRAATTRPNETLAALGPCLEHCRWKTRYAAWATLRRALPAEMADEAAQARIGHEAAPVRLAALAALAKLAIEGKSEHAKIAAISCVSDRSPRVREAAFHILGFFLERGSQDLLSYALTGVHDDDTIVQVAAIDAVGRLCTLDCSNLQGVVAALTSLTELCASAQVRAAVLEASRRLALKADAVTAGHLDGISNIQGEVIARSGSEQLRSARGTKQQQRQYQSNQRQYQYKQQQRQYQ